MKTCIKCGETKTVDDFVSDKNMSDGKRNVCKKCFAKYCRKLRVATSAYGKPTPRMAAITKTKKQNDIARYGEAVVEALDSMTGTDEDLRYLIGDTYK